MSLLLLVHLHGLESVGQRWRGDSVVPRLLLLLRRLLVDFPTGLLLLHLALRWLLLHLLGLVLAHLVPLRLLVGWQRTVLESIKLLLILHLVLELQLLLLGMGGRSLAAGAVAMAESSRP